MSIHKQEIETLLEAFHRANNTGSTRAALNVLPQLVHALVAYVEQGSTVHNNVTNVVLNDDNTAHTKALKARFGIFEDAPAVAPENEPPVIRNEATPELVEVPAAVETPVANTTEVEGEPAADEAATEEAPKAATKRGTKKA